MPENRVQTTRSSNTTIMLRSSGVRIEDLALFYLHFTGGRLVSTFRAPTKWRSARGFKAPEIWRTVFQPDLLSRTNVQRGHLGKKDGMQ
ncbi:uncharacterized protein BT62DRAFT_461868 [Guyanagaster necrorhizus]|uniref:Uncharacterized protein n=1 Tax=Guyanagaster necrorhizus TaxID=856835 RepID=A0A9P7VJV4_9AGAR|nr:uncharacterized protein BT62DRAFT_461868 [Guyanagaster necrorhizus MCA 3950]KAG7441962.1 hypothetical protein BT62DRAFT_461868 [Guyanagaster necrorhizus MCA 3950]